ncbi:trypsin-like serine typically contains c-terminal pdz domain protein [Grosmannia clavigera kw1407]|uniref:Trypsin-like serine typically contains c-terminal pdz domain protein n=1 Tax=Grosmannia clavigera (strain kw1407 / UAMH 11150) TaxID=655863 RepID=F0XCU4_GROCL|nr:trypsin-like serine typically contains c-terminal pdz domain protein [Grosmannia clavigera kw1407]EFX04206.1 trypsin-like serine typically contains c-terminal pdz domain protein [Grosmannia clavigera kw1407]
MTIRQPSIAAERPALLFNTFTDNVPAPHLTEAAVVAVDDNGRLPLQFVDLPRAGRNTQQHWYLGRATKGDIVLTYNVQPREVDIKTPVGSRIDLRRDQGGLQGVGYWFLPRVLSDATYTNIVQWLLPSDAPAGTRCVWSFGEGPKPIYLVGRTDITWNSVYMVGPICSYPSLGESSTAECVCYWFGSIPDDLDKVKDYNTELFPKMTDFFQRENEEYRIFIRKALVGFGGSGFLGSYVLEYDTSIEEESDADLKRLFTHEMVHSFSTLESEDDGSSNEWFEEGIAEYYSVVLPYRFGMCGKLDFISDVNNLVQAYFTSPRINMHIDDAAAGFFADWYAVWIPYKRGCAYFILIDSLLRQETQNLDITKRSVFDDIIIDLARRKKKGEKVQSKDWLAQVQRYLGASSNFSVNEHYQGMRRGETLDFSAVYFGDAQARFVRSSMPVLSFGFDRKSLRTRLVTGVVTGSAAERAGLHDGDEIVSASSHNRCAEFGQQLYKLIVKRGTQKPLITVEFLPRTEKKVLNWELSWE